MAKEADTKEDEGVSMPRIKEAKRAKEEDEKRKTRLEEEQKRREEDERDGSDRKKTKDDIKEKVWTKEVTMAKEADAKEDEGVSMPRIKEAKRAKGRR